MKHSKYYVNMKFLNNVWAHRIGDRRIAASSFLMISDFNILVGRGKLLKNAQSKMVLVVLHAES
jgi:hypothetical protein